MKQFFIAFTIRAWSRLTLRLTFFQSMAFQSTAPQVGAPVSVATAVICLPSYDDSPNSLVTSDLVRKSARFRVG